MVFFDSFSETAQKILIDGSEMFVRHLMLFSIFAICFIYIVYWKRHQEEKTTSWTKGIMRILMTVTSYVYLAVTPFTFLMFDPSIEFYKLFVFYFGLYSIFIIIAMIILIAEYIYLGPMLMLKIMGLDLNNERVKKVLKKIKGVKIE